MVEGGMESGKKVSVVILNWNGSEFLKKFLPSVVHCSKGNVEIIVADNGSTDDSRSVVTKSFPSVTYLQLERNFGFAEGYNQALSQLDSDYFMLLNSDVEVTPGWLEPMVKLLEQDPQVGICQPKILSLNHRNEFEYAGAAGGFIDRNGYPFCRGRVLQVVEEDMGQYDQTIQVSWASGACMLIRSQVWIECNGFDSDFWAHMEEIDLCWRAQHLGYKVLVCPESQVFHVGGGTLNYNSPLKIYLNFRNNLFLLFKNLPAKSLITKLPARMILDGMAAFVFLLKGEFGACGKVFLAHMKFYGSLPHLIKKRKGIFNNRKVRDIVFTQPYSILWNYFILKRRKYSDII
jgi:hypothetical protein